MSDQQGQQPPVEAASAQKSSRATDAPLDSTPAPPVDAEAAEAGHALDGRPGLTLSLRAGLEEHRVSVGTAGLSLSLPLGMNPFDYFKDVQSEAGDAEEMASGPIARRHGIPEMRAATAGLEAAPAAGSLSIFEMRVARMIQMMAVFGRSGGEAELRSRDRDGPRFDYFA